MFFKNVIAAVDFSSVSDRVCDKAFALAEPSGGRVHLVHALSLSELSEATLRTERPLHEALTLAELELHKLAEPRRAGGHVGELIVREGDALSVLTKAAEQLGADVIVVDSYHRGLDRLVHGSVAMSLVREAPCAVLVLREAKPA